MHRLTPSPRYRYVPHSTSNPGRCAPEEKRKLQQRKRFFIPNRPLVAYSYFCIFSINKTSIKVISACAILFPLSIRVPGVSPVSLIPDSAIRLWAQRHGPAGFVKSVEKVLAGRAAIACIPPCVRRGEVKTRRFSPATCVGELCLFLIVGRVKKKNTCDVGRKIFVC